MFGKILLSVFAVAAVAVADVPTTKETGSNAEWMKYTQPGEGHKMLTELTGKWNYTMKWWMDATTKEPKESKGTSTSKMILGGRFLQQDVTGKADGKPFQGMGVMGFDVMRNEFQSMWTDSMSTNMMLSSGTGDMTKKIVTETGTFSCAMTGQKDRWFRTEFAIADKKNHTYAMFMKDAQGTEYKTMEIHYTRK